MGRDAHEDVREGDEEAVGEETELLSAASLEGLDFDRLLEERLGEFGPYQRKLYLLVCLPAALTATITMASIFTAYSPLHRCLVPQCDDRTLPSYSDPYFFNWGFALPNSSSSYSSCWQNTPLNTTSCASSSSNSCSAACFTNTTTMACDSHVFSLTDMATSLVTEFDLVCGDQWLLPLSQSVFFAGVLVGAAVYGHLGDLLGRRSAFLLGMVQTTTAGIAAAFAPNLACYCVLMFITAMGQVGVFQCCFVLAVELVGPSWRVFCGVVIEFFFVGGELLLAVLAWWLREWRKLQLAAVAPGILFLSYFFLLPKSVRWLVQKGRHREAHAAIVKVAKGNSKDEIAQGELQLYRVSSSGPQEKESLSDLYRSPTLRNRLLNVNFNWVVITLVYYGLSMNASSLAGDVFTNFTLLSVAEFPGYLLSYLGMCLVGRRATLAASLLIGGLACLAASLTPASVPALGTTFYLLGKFGATAAFGTTYLYTSELFPTGVRNACVGLSSMCGRIGAILSPYVASLGLLTGLPWLPMAVFAALATLSGLLTLLLPETLGQPLPGTLQEAERMGKQRTELLVNSETEE